MTEKDTLQQDWKKIVTELSTIFAEGDHLTIDSILYLIGVQELGKGFQEFSKDDKVNLMHIAVCRLLQTYGYYKFDYFDSDDWPHYKRIKELPNLKTEAQSDLMKKAIIQYFK